MKPPLPERALPAPEASPGPSRRRLLMLTAATGVVAACGRREEKAADPGEPPAPTGPREGTLEWAVAGDWRTNDSARDVWRHPLETLTFFGLQPGMTVVEFWPGAGWYTEILGPYLARGGGKLYAAGFELGETPVPAQAQLMERFRDRFRNRRVYGDVEITEFGPTSVEVAPAGSADLALFMRSLHLFMAAGLAEKAFADAFVALKPGGILGIEQHRAAADEDQDPAAASGYVQEAFVRQLAEEAGFVFVEASDINANPEDTKDHPFGVETLPPQRLSAPMGEPPDPTFDHTPYDEIGESDRMTLKFRKPA